jgi:ComF family protein
MHIREAARSGWNGLLDLLYPPRCLICGRDEAEPFCATCLEEIVPLNAPYCDRCGVPVSPGRLVCEHCEEGPEPMFAWSQAVGQYSGVLRTAIHRLKYESKAALAAPLGELLVRSFELDTPLCPKNGQFDCIVPVPLHTSKLQSRGFNQAELIARMLAARINIPLEAQGLRRVRKARTQTAFHRRERQHNIERVFDTSTPLCFDGNSVLLIDDVLTTMATVNECSRVLSNAGAKRVAVLALARGL